MRADVADNRGELWRLLKEYAPHHRILIDTARRVGDEETARTCEQILQEEEAMARWLEQNLPVLTRQYLAREQTPGARSTT